MATPLVFIDGEQGTTGLQIHQRLRDDPRLRLLTLPAHQRKDPQYRAEALNQCDVAVLCLPDEAAREAVAMVRNPAVRVLDASSAHRTSPGWVYGFAEMAAGQPQRIADAARVSNPGCYPTAAIGLLRPLLQAGLLPEDLPLAIHAVSGYSGGGRAGVAAYEDDEASPPVVQLYGLGLAHKHVPEIQRYAGLAARPVFLPAYAAFRQGIALTIALPGAAALPLTHLARLREVLQAHYADSPRIQVLDEAATCALETLDPAALAGSDGMQLGVLVNEAHRHAVLFALLDNLGKGAAGAAVQNLHLMLGLAG